MAEKPVTANVTATRIVEAAAQLFARQGFKGTTTREIAQLAALNEATLFRYFPRKPELFWAAVESQVSRVKLARETQSSLAADDAPAIVVPLLITFILDSLNSQPELQRLLHVAAFELPQADNLIREHLGPIFDMVSAYFERCAGKGTLRPVLPSLATLGLLGVITAHQSWIALFREKISDKMSDRMTGQTIENDSPFANPFASPFASPFANQEQAVSAFTALWLHGLLP